MTGPVAMEDAVDESEGGFDSFADDVMALAKTSDKQGFRAALRGAILAVLDEESMEE